MVLAALALWYQCHCHYPDHYICHYHDHYICRYLCVSIVRSVAKCLINAEPCGPSTSAREGAGLWLEGPGFGRGVRKPDPLSWVNRPPACMEVPRTCRWCRIVARCAGTDGGNRVLRDTGVQAYGSGTATAANTEASNRYCSCNRSSVVGLYQLGRSAGGGGCRRGACGVGWVGFDWFGGSGG